MGQANLNSSVDGARGSRGGELPPLTDLSERGAKAADAVRRSVEDGLIANQDAITQDGDTLDNLNGDVPGGRAMAKALKATGKAESRATSEEHDGAVMPALEDILEEATVAKTLSPAELGLAYETARTLDFRNALKTMDFGLDEQRQASEVTRAFLEEVRGTDLEELSRLASDSNQKMEELNIGELKPSLGARILRKILPARQANAVRQFLDKHKAISDVISANEQAMAEERLKLEQHHSRMQEKIKENQLIYTRLGQKIGAAELSYGANKKQVEEFKSEYEGSADPAKSREISVLDQALTRQARRVNSLKASRQETLTALRTMDIQLQGIESQIAMIDEQQAFNRMVWDNTVLMAATDRRMKDSVRAVTYNRGQIETMMQKRSGSIGETLQSILAEQKAGVINVAVLKYAADELVRMNRAIIDGNKKIREGMKEADAVIFKMDELVKDVAAQAAAMTPDDLRKLDERLKVDGVEIAGSAEGAEKQG